MTPKIVITGCGRSGTQYMSRVLSEAGIPCGHERVISIHCSQTPTSKLDWGSLQADSSWIAVPRLAELKRAGVHIYHQVRNPIEVVRAFLGIRFFHDGEHALLGDRCTNNPHTKFVWDFDKGIFLWDNPVFRSMAYWVRWNTLAAAWSRFTYRVEGLDEELLGEILRDAKVPAEAASQALESVDRSTGHGPRMNWSFPSDNPSTGLWRNPGRLTDDFINLAERYGYSPEKLDPSL